MDAQRWERVCALFDEARLAPIGDREAILDRAADLRDEVQGLLDHHERQDAPLSSESELAAGAEVGRYRVITPLGTGGMGSVYLAQGPEGRVALKVLHPHLARRPGFTERFAREASMGARIRHRNVVRTYGAEGDHTLVMEYVEGQTLDRLMKDMGAVPENLCRHVGIEVAKGLEAIHAHGVVHRDLKPENILVTPEHDIKLMDFGVAFLHDDQSRLSQTGQFVGTVRYSAPEHIDGKGRAPDARSDLYALGLVLYELATGQHPVPAGDVAAMMRAQLEGNFRRLGEINPQYSAFFEELVHTLLATSPALRFARADSVLSVLRTGEDGSWWDARAQAVIQRTHRPLRRVRVPRDTAVYGRETELAEVDVAYERATGGRGQVLLVIGEAGIGKTRLVDEAAARIRARASDVHLLFGSHPLGAAAQGTHAIRGALAVRWAEAPTWRHAWRRCCPIPLGLFQLLPASCAEMRPRTTHNRSPMARCMGPSLRRWLHWVGVPRWSL